MFVYAVLIVASLVMAIAIPLIYYLFKSAGTVIRESVVPPPREVSRGDAKPRPMRTTDQFKPLPMGLVTSETRALLAWADPDRSKTATQFYGDSSDYRPRNPPSAPKQEKAPAQAGWLVREDRSTEVGKTYKVTRRAKPENRPGKPKQKP